MTPSIFISRRLRLTGNAKRFFSIEIEMKSYRREDRSANRRSICIESQIPLKLKLNFLCDHSSLVELNRKCYLKKIRVINKKNLNIAHFFRGHM